MTSSTFQHRVFPAPVSRKTSSVLLLLLLGTFWGIGLFVPSAKFNVPTTSNTIKRLDGIFLPINPTSTLAKDVLSVQHLPHLSQFVVTFQAASGALRCPSPYLMGRLSGPALAMMEFKESKSQKAPPPTYKTTRQVFQYRVPRSGTYFVDIIVIMCHDFRHNWSYDFTKTCVEDPQRNRLISDYNVQIEVKQEQASLQRSSSQSSLSSSSLLTGYWLHNIYNDTTTKIPNYEYVPVYTRFQPVECLPLSGTTALNSSHCTTPTSWTRFEPYTTFQYYQIQEQALEQAQMLHLTNPFPKGAASLWASQPTKVCFVGDSHSRNLYTSLQQYHKISPQNNNIEITYPLTSKHPRNVHTKIIASAELHLCDTIILAVGQWPASFQSGSKPTLFDDYQNQIRTMIARLHDNLKTRNNTNNPQHKNHHGRPVEIILRSIHYNPLNGMISGTCPPLDWRNPVVIDGYNAIIREAVQDYAHAQIQQQHDTNVSSLLAFPIMRFVDTNFIVGAMWDASLDWGHVPPVATHVEALYLLGVTLGAIQD